MTSSVKKILKGALTLATGNIAAKAISVLSIPLLTRLYSPEQHGKLAVFVAIVTIIAPIMNARFPIALPLCSGEKERSNLAALCFLASVMASLVMIGILLPFHSGLASYFNTPEITEAWPLIIMGGFLLSNYESLTMYFVSIKSYSSASKATVINSAFTEGSKVTLSLNPSLMHYGLIYGYGLGLLCANLFMAIKTIPLIIKEKISLLDLKASSKKFASFPQYRLPSQVLLIICTQAATLFCAANYDASTAGQLALALMAVGLPVNLIGTALSKSFYSELSTGQKINSTQVFKTTLDIQKKLFLISIPCCLIIYYHGETLFKLFFGEAWSQSGLFASSLSLYLLFQFTSSPLIQVFNIYNNQKFFLLINIVRLAALSTLLYLTEKMELSANSFCLAYSYLMSTFYLIISAYIVAFLYKHHKRESSRGN